MSAGAADPAVLIVGAGPTGLALALRLAAHRVPFRIIDRNSGPGQASRAMVVHARTLEFYQQLGFADEVVARGVPIEAVHVREGGREAAAVTLTEMGNGLSPFPFMLAYAQDDHERFLVGKLEAAGMAVEWDTELTSFEQDEAGVRAVLDRAGVAEVCEAAYLCGCDGAHSRVREVLGLGFPGGTYQQRFFVADVRVEGAFQTDGFMNLGASGFVLMLPVRQRGMQRLIGIVPEQLAHREDLCFADVREAAEPLLGVRVAEVNWFSTYNVHHRVAARLRAGRCFIAGDAGHIHSPAGGQGMNTGIGDAVNLSWKLADVLHGRADASLLDTYETERIAFARKLVATTDRVFRGIVGRGRGGRFLRTWAMPRLISLLTRFSAVRRMVFKTISQVRISYRDSALSEGRAGAVRGGDRLPWVGPDDCDNFAPLRSLGWQLHVYGEAGMRLKEAADALGLPMHRFSWNDAVAEAGLQRDAAYLVRPDGHVAWVASDQDALGLRRFVDERGLDFRPTG